MQELANATKRIEAMKLVCDQNAKTPTKKKLAKMIKSKVSECGGFALTV